MTVQISTFEGGEAFSPFKTQRLLQSLQQQAPAVSGLQTLQVFLVATSQALSDSDSARMARLLDAVARLVAPDPSLEQVCWVSTRLGTVSPWASKASDIARNCGFAVQRIERLVQYRLKLNARLTPDESLAVQALLHDRMTESLWQTQAQAHALFQPLPALALSLVDIQSQGRQALEQANTDWGLALAEDVMQFSRYGKGHSQ